MALHISIPAIQADGVERCCKDYLEDKPLEGNTESEKVCFYSVQKASAIPSEVIRTRLFQQIYSLNYASLVILILFNQFTLLSKASNKDKLTSTCNCNIKQRAFGRQKFFLCYLIHAGEGIAFSNF